MSDCLFCKIINREIPGEIILENEHILAFKDINPVAPFHILLIPKVHIANVLELSEHPDAAHIMNECLKAISEITKTLDIQESGFRVLTNVGEEAGQTVFHLHWHILGGRSFHWPPG